MVRVCDSIMGSGKSSAAINYMLEHKDTDRFIYVTPFLGEAERIREACTGMDFQLPSKDIKYDNRKREHLAALVDKGCNIATTHKLFACCNNAIADTIQEQQYTIIVDEVIDIFEDIKLNTRDLNMLVKQEHIIECKLRENSSITYYELNQNNPYDGWIFSKFFIYAENKRLIRMSDKNEMFCAWEFNTRLFSTAKEVIILTYLFEHTPLRCLMEMNHIKYERIYVQKDSVGKHQFVGYPTPQPEYVKDLSKLIHVCEEDKLNGVGDAKGSLSCSWIKSQSKLKNNGKLDILRKKLNTFFKLRCSHVPSSDRMWSTFKSGEKHLRAGGFIKSFVAFNCRAVNGLRNKQALAYLVNIFVNPNLKRYLYENNVTINDDGYALHTMIQWIWRSAIRDGKEIWIYVPSKRMRTLLQNWIQEVSSDNANEHHANTLDA